MQIEDKHLIRFMDKVGFFAPDKCWEWKKKSKSSRYGQIRYKNKLWLAHRFSFYLATGLDPGNLSVCHTCDNGFCINPDHLWLGTHKQNMNDRDRKARNGVNANKAKTHCKNGHEFNEKNTYWRSHDKRDCRVCKNVRQKEAYYRKRMGRGHGRQN